MGVFEKYYMFSAASERVLHLLATGKCVKSWRDIEDGKPVWKVEWR